MAQSLDTSARSAPPTANRHARAWLASHGPSRVEIRDLCHLSAAAHQDPHFDWRESWDHLPEGFRQSLRHTRWDSRGEKALGFCDGVVDAVHEAVEQWRSANDQPGLDDSIPPIDGWRPTVLIIEGRRWVVASEIARGIGYSRPDKVARLVSRLADDGEALDGRDFRKVAGDDLAALRQEVPPVAGVTSKFTPSLLLLSARGLQLVLLHARTTMGAAFRAWVLDELIPALQSRTQLLATHSATHSGEVYMPADWRDHLDAWLAGMDRQGRAFRLEEALAELGITVPDRKAADAVEAHLNLRQWCRRTMVYREHHGPHWYPPVG